MPDNSEVGHVHANRSLGCVASKAAAGSKAKIATGVACMESIGFDKKGWLVPPSKQTAGPQQMQSGQATAPQRCPVRSPQPEQLEQLPRVSGMSCALAA